MTAIRALNALEIVGPCSFYFGKIDFAEAFAREHDRLVRIAAGLSEAFSRDLFGRLVPALVVGETVIYILGHCLYLLAAGARTSNILGAPAVCMMSLCSLPHAPGDVDAAGLSIFSGD